MTRNPTPAATSQTKPNNQGGVTPVNVTPPRKVTYVFKANSSSGLRIPYAVAVDNAVLAAFAERPRRVSGNGGKVTVTVLQGQRVHLFLNSDAASGFRSAPVYAVTVGDRDIEVTISEKTGKHTDPDTPFQQKDADAKAEAAKKADTYTAPLTGDIWKKVSHKYTSAEVGALMPPGTAVETIAAIKTIYDGLPSPTLTVSIAATGRQPAKQLTVTFEDSNNPKENISSYALLTDGLPRVHPGGYAALLNAALGNDITLLTVTSCWRPMLGSIAHRAGLGLDVNYIGRTRVNRQELRGGIDTDNVSKAELVAFREFEEAIIHTKKEKADSEKANMAFAAARKSGDPEKVAEAKNQASDAKAAMDKAAELERKSRERWNSERDIAEPAHAHQFRVSLLKCSCVSQLFDPWFMDSNTKDAIAPEPNMQRGASTSNERLHAHHLHITVFEPRIL
jgi:biotin carboxyl carrier protein